MTNYHNEGFEVSKAVKIQIKIFWIMTSCSVVVGYQRFGQPYYSHLLGCDTV